MFPSAGTATVECRHRPGPQLLDVIKLVPITATTDRIIFNLDHSAVISQKNIVVNIARNILLQCIKNNRLNKSNLECQHGGRIYITNTRADFVHYSRFPFVE